MNEKEKEIIFLLAQKLTGAHPDGTFQHGIFLTNVEKRMRETKIKDVATYLEFAKVNEQEHAHLVSALSIHTTSWFRENPHYVVLQKIILKFAQTQQIYKVWSCACSTGEEVYSLALLFEEFRSFNARFNYSLLGTDIDPVSVENAKRAIYDKKYLQGPVSFYKKHILLGSGPTEDYFTVTKDVRSRCAFKAHDVRQPMPDQTAFDLIVCRNILIYFPAHEVERIVQGLAKQLKPGGHLILGHSEMINYQKLGLVLRGHAVYEKPMKPTEVKAAEASPEMTTSKWKTHSQKTTLTPGADEKPVLNAIEHKKPSAHFVPELILVGASTGGPQALSQILRRFEVDCPPIVIVQHISTQFALGFASTLSDLSGLKLGHALDKTKLERGHLYVAESDCHVGVELKDGNYLVRQVRRPAINGHRPSIDYLFSSAIDSANKCVAILLSGMGHDGAMGMELIHNAGAYTMAQSEADCVVFGMPKEAIDIKAVDFIGSADQIQGQLRQITQRR